MIPTTLDPSKLKRHELHRWADYIELSCLDDPDGELPLVEALRESWGFETGLAGSFADNEADDSDFDHSGRAEFEDKLETKFHDLVKQFLIRGRLLGEDYPFEVMDRVLVRKEQTDAHRLYMYLLRAANLSFHEKSHSKALTTGFERLAYHALEVLFPPAAKIALFGTAGHEAYNCYPGKKYEKLCAFAKDMGTKVDADHISEETYPDQDSGDDGLDIAAWYPFDDHATHFPLILAQAGCTANEKDMLAKQYEVDARTWANKIRDIWPVSMMLTPQCYRKASGGWVQPAKVASIFVDRVRLMILLSVKAGDFVDDMLPLYSEAV